MGLSFAQLRMALGRLNADLDASARRCLFRVVASAKGTVSNRDWQSDGCAFWIPDRIDGERSRLHAGASPTYLQARHSPHSFRQEVHLERMHSRDSGARRLSLDRGRATHGELASTSAHPHRFHDGFGHWLFRRNFEQCAVRRMDPSGEYRILPRLFLRMEYQSSTRL